MSRGVGLDRERVLQLAEAIADREGAEALTLTRLADEAGVRKPSLYKHVDGLPDVLSSLTLRAYAAMADLLERTEVHDDPERALCAFAEAWRQWALAHPGTYVIASRTHVGGEAQVFREGARMVAAVTGRVRRLGVSEADAVHAVRGFRSLVHGFVLLELSGGYGLDVDVSTSFRRSVSALVRGWTP